MTKNHDAKTADAESPTSRPWWREPWPWILLAGPAVVLAACAVTVVLAIQAYGDQAITEGAVRHGLVVEKVPAP